MRVAHLTGNGRAALLAAFHSLFLLALSAASALVLLGGCAGTHRVGGSSLSDAIAEAAAHDDDRDDRDDRDDDGDDDDGDRDEPRRVLRAGRPVHEPDVVVVHDRPDYRRCERREPPESRGRREQPRVFLGASAAGASFHGNALEDAGTLALRAGIIVPDTRERLMVEGELAVSDLAPASGPGAGTEDMLEISAGIGARWYVTPAWTSAGLCALGGMRVGGMRWSYASPILVDDGWDVYEVGSDWLTTYTPYVGVGMDLLHDQPVRVGVVLVQGLRFYDRYTTEGFRNDVFDPEIVSELRFELNGLLR